MWYILLAIAIYALWLVNALKNAPDEEDLWPEDFVGTEPVEILEQAG